MAYPEKTWAKVKADYLTGNFSVEELQKKYGISTATIDKRMKKDGNWIKGKLKEKIQEKVEERTIDIFTRLGMPPEKIVQKVIEGMNANKTYIKGNGEEAFIEVEEDHNTRHKFVQEANKMTGGYAPEKIEETIKNIQPTREDLKSLTDEELAAMQSMINKMGGEDE